MVSRQQGSVVMKGRFSAQRILVFFVCLSVGWMLFGCGSSSPKIGGIDVTITGDEGETAGEGTDVIDESVDGGDTHAMCLDGYYWFQDYCYKDACPEGAYLADAENRECSACEANCAVCVDATTCTVCAQDGYLFQGDCYPGACPQGTIPSNGNEHVCSACESNCDTCADETTCTACSVGYYLSQGNCFAGSCPEGTILSDAINRICSTCESNCTLCLDATTCSQCASAYYLYQANCFAGACPENAFLSDPVNRICSGCSDEYFLYQGNCYPGSCPPGSYLSDALSRICSACESNCSACASATICSQCAADYYLYQGDCHAGACPEDTVLSDPVNRVCSGCSDEYYLYQGNCYPGACPAGSYISDPLSRICSPCGVNCGVCSDATTCSICLAGYYQYEGRCYSGACPAGTNLSDPTNRICSACESNCTACASATTCSGCSAGYYLYQGDCFAGACPEGSTLSDPVNRICSACGTHCETCSNGTTCTACSTGYFLYEGYCYPGSCPTGAYLSDTANRICSACESHCDTCTNATTCTGCSSGYYLYQANCYSGACPTGTYLSDAGNRVCSACESHCDACTNATSCSDCAGGYGLYQGDCIEGLVAYYPFNGNANDASGNGHHGTVYGGATLVADRFGGASSAYSFDGVDDRIDCGTSSDFALNTLTISVWYAENAYSAMGGGLVSKSTEAAGEIGYRLSMDSHVNAMVWGRMGSPGGWVLPSSQVSPPGGWHHLVGIKSGSTMYLYQDGTSVGSVSGVTAALNTSNPFRIGCVTVNVGPFYFFNGRIDDVRVYNRALSANEVVALYSEGDWPSCTSAGEGRAHSAVIPSLGRNQTFEGWFFFHSYKLTSLFRAWSDCGCAFSMNLLANGNFSAHGSSSGDNVASGPAPLNEWVHIAVSYTADTKFLYVNGVLAASGGGTAGIVNCALGIGGINDEHDDLDIDGFFDEVRVSSGRRYSSNFTPSYPLTSDATTIALWHFDEGSGTSCSDSSGNNYDAHLVTATWQSHCADE